LDGPDASGATRGATAAGVIVTNEANVSERDARDWGLAITAWGFEEAGDKPARERVATNKANSARPKPGSPKSEARNPKVAER
jgi:hypothetical protein